MTAELNALPTNTTNLLWRFSPNRPANPNVQVIFRGLMGFCYQTVKRECEVAFNREDASHHLKIVVSEKNKPPIYVSPQVIPRSVKVELGIERKANDVGFYYSGSPDSFDRRSGHPQDFRWLLDLESPGDGYGDELAKNRDFFAAKLYLRQGTLYTFQHTNSTFMALGLLHPFRFVGHMPKYTVADIEVAPAERLYLKIDGVDVLPAGSIDPAKKYEIYFLNECFDDSGRRCQESDFDLNFEAVELALPLRFALMTLFRGRDDAPPGLSIESVYQPQNTDSAPCMGVGFGLSDGFPPEN